jgi:hypothetical protein
MKPPKTLLIADGDGNTYQVKDIEGLKESVINEENMKWSQMVYFAYRDTLFMYQFENTMRKLKNLQMIKQTRGSEIDLDDLDASVGYWRSQLVRELGNGSVTKANSEVERMWQNIENETQNKDN